MKKRLLCMFLSFTILISTFTVLTSAASVLPSNTVKNYLALGDYITIAPAQDANGTVKYTNYVLSGENGGNYAGSDVQMWKFGTASKWCVRRVVDGAFALIASNFEESQDVSDTKDIFFWDIESKSTSVGANIHMWKDDDLNDESKLFYIVDNNDSDPETFYIGSYYTRTKNLTRYLAPEGFWDGTSWAKDGCNTVLSSKPFLWRIQIVSRESGNALPVDVSWMDNIPDCTLLSSMNIPGTHDTAATNTGDIAVGDLSIARCQKYFIDELLIAGVRALDMRLGEKDGQVVLNHSLVTCYHKDHGTNKDKPITLKNALDEIKAFLKKYPSETVIFLIKKDNGGDSVVTNALSILAGYKSILYDWSDPSPTLGKVRGKIVLMSRLETSNYPSYLGPDLRNWDANYNDSLHFAQNVAQSNSVCKVWIQDDYSCSYNNKKQQVLNTAKQLNGTLGTTDGQTPPTIAKKDFVFNYTSIATSVYVTTPLEGSHTMNSYLMEDLKNQGYFNTSKRMGIIMMDFADKAMARLIIDSNKTYTLSADGHSYRSAVTAPTCTKNGYTTYTCVVCGASYTDNEVAALGHSLTYTSNGDTHTAICGKCDFTEVAAHEFVNGTCICLEVEPAKPVYVETAALTVAPAISIGAEIRVVYTITTKQISSYENFRLEVVKTAADGQSATTVFGAGEDMVAFEPVSAGGNIVAYRAVYTGIGAKNMGDEFTAVLYAETSNGQIHYGNADPTSIKTYIMTKLDDESTTDTFRTLGVDMLDYGAAAQLNFDYNTQELVNADLTEAQRKYGTQKAASAENKQMISGSGASVIANVSVQNKVMLFVTARYTASSDSDLKFVIKAADTGTVLAIQDATTVGTAYRCIYEDVGAKQMRQLITIELQDKGTTVSQVLTWSVESYVAATRASAATSETLLNMVNALLIYGDSAAAYLTK